MPCLRTRARTDAGQDSERRRPRGLVDQDHAGRFEGLRYRHRSRGPAQARSPGAANSATMKDVISSIERSLEKPAACRWPPPFDFRAIAETSTRSVEDRSEIFRKRTPVAWWLANQGRELGPFDCAENVDDPFRVRLHRADVGEVATKQVRDDDAPLLVQRGPLERPREQLQLCELHRLVHALEHTLGVGTCLEQFGREPQCLRRRVRVLKPPGIRDEPRVERLGDIGCQSDAEPGEHVRQHLGRRRSLGDDEIRGSEARVVVMVVDVHEHRGLEQPLVREPRLLGAVDRDQNPIRRVVPVPHAAARGTEARETRTRRGAAPPRRAPSRCPCRPRRAPGASRAATRARRRPGSRAR